MVLFRLPPHPVQRFYRGGKRIARFRRAGEWPPLAPEEWLASTTTVYGEAEVGLSRLEDGRVLRDVIAADPLTFLGPEHVERFGPEPSLLVKLLDAEQRLPVHYHPDDDIARQKIHYAFGKTEAWFVIHADPGSVVWLGLRRPVTPEELAQLLVQRDSEELLKLLVEVPVQVGDALYVPAGTPHAIGDGIMIVELQQASDLSILLEWWLFGEQFEANWHLGLGHDGALAAVSYLVWDEDRLRHNVRRVVRQPGRFRLFPEAADRFFRGERIVCRGSMDLEAGYQLLIILEGQGLARATTGASLAFEAGDVFLAAHAAGPLTLEGDFDAVRCLPGVPY
ncbi:MAG: type I phosphomannose isomerase catalytic subunit [Thermomicrobium sp.]